MAKICIAALMMFLGSFMCFANSSWIEVKSPHFTVMTDAGIKKGRNMALALERIRAIMQLHHPEYQLDPGRPLLVFAPGSSQAFDLLRSGSRMSKKDRGDGFYREGALQHYITLSAHINQDFSNNLYHEYQHVVHKLNYPYLPLWLDEGLAEYYESSSLEFGTATVGYMKASTVRMIHNKYLLPIEELVASREDSRNYQVRTRMPIYYAQSWALVHLLIQQGRLSPLLERIRQGEPVQEAIYTGLGDLKALRESLFSYVYTVEFPEVRRPLPFSMDSRTFSSRTLTLSEVIAHVAFMLLDCDDLEAADHLLARPELDRTNPLLPEVLAFRHFRAGDDGAALGQLELVSETRRTFRTEFLRGLAHNRLGQVAQATASFSASSTLNPRFVPALSQYGLLLTLSRDPFNQRKGLAQIDRALSIELGYAMAQYHRVLALQRSGLHDAAVAEGLKMLNQDPSPTVRELIQKAISHSRRFTVGPISSSM